MKKRLITVALIATLSAVTILPATPAFADKTKKEEAVEQLATIKAETEKATADAKTTTDKIQATQDQLVAYDKEVRSLKENIASRQTQLKEQARNVQKEGTTDNYLDFIFSSKSITDAVSRISVVNEIVSANTKVVKDVKADQDAVEEKQNASKDLVKQQQADLEKLQTTQADLAKKQKAQEDVIAQVVAEEEAAAKAAADLAAQVATPVAATTATTTPTTEVATAPAASTPNYGASAGSIVAEAMKYIGVPYVWGGKTPAGFDCSGFTSYVYQRVTGRNIGGFTVPQESAGPKIAVSQAKAGDLLFWGSAGSTYHVAIALGGGSYIHAPTEGQTVTVANSAYFAPSFAVSMS